MNFWPFFPSFDRLIYAFVFFFSNSFLHFCNRSGVLFIFLFPILQCTCFYLAIGDNPKSLKLGIVNDEVPNWQDCYNDSLVTAQVYDYDCNLTKVSCRYLRDIPPEYAIQVPNKPIEDFFFMRLNLTNDSFTPSSVDSF